LPARHRSASRTRPRPCNCARWIAAPRAGGIDIRCFVGQLCFRVRIPRLCANRRPVGPRPDPGNAARARVAVWDVCAAAERTGSLDASIARETISVSDFQGFFAAHPAVCDIAFNGKLAAQLYERRVLPDLARRWQGIQRMQLPSTSPAHAAMPFAGKRRYRQKIRKTLRVG
jgi:hypothetical protein